MTQRRIKKIVLVCGARPNFMKIAPLVKELKKDVFCNPILVHTGQHYDREMSALFFKDLGLPKPNKYLNVGSASHGVQTARILEMMEAFLIKEKPALVVVVGDVNSTLAASLAAAKLCIPIAHVEAGLRSHDRSMPEEINRLVTDSLSDILFTSCRDADQNLRREGICSKKIFFVGNIMMDTLVNLRQKSQGSLVLKRLGLQKKKYAVLTLHRPSNVDDRQTLGNIFSALKQVARDIKIVFPAHPRTQKQLKRFKVLKDKDIVVIKPLGYLDFMKLNMNARLVLTDSGGIQEETTFLKIPCLTIRPNTERPITITEGTNILVTADPDKIKKECVRILRGKIKKGRNPKFWDGKTATRIVRVLAKHI